MFSVNMQLWVFPFLAAVIARTNSFGIAEMVSNYAKVSVNKGNVTERNITIATTTLSPVSTTTLANSITNDSKSEMNDESEEEIPAYDDFDDLQAATERSQTQTPNAQTMLKYFNGLVSLLAMMYQFNGTPSSVQPQKLHFGASRPREGGRDELAEGINDLAEARYNPTTATKKFKLAQGGYLPPKSSDVSPSLPPPSSGMGYPPVDSYPAYPSPPADSYSINGGKTSYDSDESQYMAKNPEKGKMEMMKPHSMYGTPMKDYMSQNDVDIQQSYSYQIPDAPKMKQPTMPVPEMVDYKYLPPKSAPEKEQMPTYYPWLKESKPQIKPWSDHSHHEHDNHPEIGNSPVYYPWMNSKPKRPKPPPTPPPPEEMNDEEDNDDEHQPWASGKPLNEFDHHSTSYQYWQDHDHHFNHDHLHDEENEEEDDDMKDEDRESKHPQHTYYHLGRKLWYVPLLFSLYFIIYIGALVLKSVARHKIQLPEKLHELAAEHHHDHHRRRQAKKLNQATERILTKIEDMENKYM